MGQAPKWMRLNTLGQYDWSLNQETPSTPRVCLLARPACLHCQFTSLIVHHQNCATYPPTPEGLGRKKLFQSGLIHPLLPVFITSGSLAPLFIISGQMVKLKQINCLWETLKFGWTRLSLAQNHQGQSVWPVKSCQISMKVAQKGFLYWNERHLNKSA